MRVNAWNAPAEPGRGWHSCGNASRLTEPTGRKVKAKIGSTGFLFLARINQANNHVTFHPWIALSFPLLVIVTVSNTW